MPRDSLHPPFSRLKGPELPRSHRPADEAKRRIADRGGHPPHLPIAALDQGDGEPRGGDGAPLSDRRSSGPQVWRVDQGDVGRFRHPVSESNAFRDPAESNRGRNSLHLNPVRLGDFVSRVANPGLKASVISQDDESFTIEVEPAGGIDVGKGNIVSQRGSAPAVGELA